MDLTKVFSDSMLARQPYIQTNSNSNQNSVTSVASTNTSSNLDALSQISQSQQLQCPIAMPRKLNDDKSTFNYAKNPCFANAIASQQQQYFPLYDYNTMNCIGDWKLCGTIELQNASEIMERDNLSAPIPIYEIVINLEYRSSSCTKKKYDYRVVLSQVNHNFVLVEQSNWLQDGASISLPGRDGWNYIVKLNREFEGYY